MDAKVFSCITSRKLISPGDKIYAAVSGGVDSMVLLYILNSLKSKLSISLHVIHINHKIRKIETDLDEDLVRETCKKLEIPFFCESLKGFDLSSSENHLREARYRCFDDVLEKNPGAKIVTAHHLNDQLETFLMRLSKGSSLRGLRGIPIERPGYIRPMLYVEKGKIVAYAKRNNIPYRIDHTNADTQKTRNKIRHELVPELEKVMGENFLSGFGKSIDDLQETYLAFNDLSARLFEKIVINKDGNTGFSKNKYTQLTEKLRRHLLEYCVSMFKSLNFSIPEHLFRQFDAFVSDARTGAYFTLSKEMTVLKDRNFIYFSYNKDELNIELELSEAQSVSIGRNKILIKPVTDRQIKFSTDPRIEYICGDRIKFPLKVRHWREGDFFYPLGMNGKQKLSDFFINQKLSRYKKMDIPVLINQNEIVWIAGFQIDNRYKITKKCNRFYELRIQ
ncbi:MAG: tRNA lysidine(34) synthetase TilS [Calditrichaceae bacterium]